MDLSWIKEFESFREFWPAVKRLRFWACACRIAIGGLLVGLAIFATYQGAASLISPGAAEPKPTVAESEPAQQGHGWQTPVLLCWVVGTLLISALRLWKAERGGDSAAVLDDLREIPICYGQIFHVDGCYVLGRWGHLFAQNNDPQLLSPQKAGINETAFGSEVLTDLFRDYLADGFTPGDLGIDGRVDWSETRRQIQGLLDELETHRVLDRVTDFYFITEPGKPVLVAAQRLTKGSAWWGRRAVPTSRSVARTQKFPPA